MRTIMNGRSWAMGMVLFAALLAFPAAPVLAQEATPVATPVAGVVAGGIPCTELFGIAAGSACVLVIHGSDDAGPVDVYVDGSLALAGATFGTLGDFVPVPAGQRQFQIVPSGAAPEDAVIDTRADLVEGVAYEIAALGPLAGIEGLILPVDTRPLANEAARIRVVHGSASAPAVDLAIVGGAPLVIGLEPGAVSESIVVPSGIYELEVRVAVTTDVALPLPGTSLAANTTHTFYVLGSAEAGTLGVTLAPVLITPEIAAAATPVA